MQYSVGVTGTHNMPAGGQGKSRGGQDSDERQQKTSKWAACSTQKLLTSADKVRLCCLRSEESSASLRSSLVSLITLLASLNDDTTATLSLSKAAGRWQQTECSLPQRSCLVCLCFCLQTFVNTRTNLLRAGVNLRIWEYVNTWAHLKVSRLKVQVVADSTWYSNDSFVYCLVFVFVFVSPLGLSFVKFLFNFLYFLNFVRSFVFSIFCFVLYLFVRSSGFFNCSFVHTLFLVVFVR